MSSESQETDEEEMVELEGDDGFETSPFAGVEDASDAPDTPDEGEDGGEPSLSPDDDEGGAMAKSINNGFARLSVIGLSDEYKGEDNLEGELVETFESFRLGYYGEKVFEEYISADGDEISPIWGLLGAAAICGAVVLMKRPDSDELMEKVTSRLSLAVGSVSEERAYRGEYETENPQEVVDPQFARTPQAQAQAAQEALDQTVETPWDNEDIERVQQERAKKQTQENVHR